MVLSYKGVSSTSRPLPGSTPQGAFLGIFLFIVKFNGAALRPRIPRYLPYSKCNKPLRKCHNNDCPEHPRDIHAVYIDDLSELEAVNLKSQLVIDNSNRPRPLKRHERTMHCFPGASSKLQKNIEKIENFTEANLMKINESKSNIMVFTNSRKFDFPPEFAFKNSSNLAVLETEKLLGVHIDSNLKWKTNTNEIYKKAMSRMWLLRRMKALRLDPSLILDYYLKEIRPVTEHAVVTWNSGLTSYQSKQLEKIQKIALITILGHNYGSYSLACNKFNLSTLAARREQLCINFALKLYQSERSNQFFKPAKSSFNTRNPTKLVQEKICRTSRYYNSPLSYLSRLVNQNLHKLKEK